MPGSLKSLRLELSSEAAALTLSEALATMVACKHPVSAQL